MDLSKANIVKPDRLSDRIDQILRGAIFSGELKPGDKLPTEEKIAADLGVSKVTVREALRQMEAEGLIEKRRGKQGGSFVASPTHDKISQLITTYIRRQALTLDHLAQFRLTLEPRLAGLAALNRTEEDLTAIKENLEKTQSRLDAGQADLDLSIQFHRLLVAACHNPIFSAVVTSVVEVFMDSITQEPPTLEVIRTDHSFNLRLYDCLVSQDQHQAEKVMEENFHYFKEIVTGDHLD